ncbi:MAG TPA: FG-GAP-like repeat-containing protein, partial [Rhodanobacteraceae bacterium]|nr:FG-GAP-like repeat-containing protein [Rhodanobacteraceae bacterium]
MQTKKRLNPSASLCRQSLAPLLRLTLGLGGVVGMAVTGSLHAQVWGLGSADVVLEGAPAFANDQYGTALAVGNVDGDGFSDLAIGAPLYNSVNGGLFELYRGGASGFTWFQTQYSPTGARLAAALVFGDFDGDGIDELATGRPYAPFGSQLEAGAVFVHSFIPGGSGTALQQGMQLQGVPNSYDHMGAALAVGDFNDDGYDDLAIGVPGENVVTSAGGTAVDAGVVMIVPGSASGLNFDADQMFSQSALGGVQGNARFGEVLASGDFNGDNSYDDLAVGVPHRDVDGQIDSGQVVVLYSNGNGLVSTNAQVLTSQDLTLLNEAGDQFGAALATGDFNRTPGCWNQFRCRTDLVIGVPGEDQATASGSLVDVGVVVVVSGSDTGIDPASAHVILQSDLLDGASLPEVNDHFGAVLASHWLTSSYLLGSWRNPSPDNLVIGVPDEGWQGVNNAGVVHLVFGGPSGLLSGRQGQYWVNWNGLASAPGATNQHFGEALAIGDFNADGHAELAVGIP